MSALDPLCTLKIYKSKDLHAPNPLSRPHDAQLSHSQPNLHGKKLFRHHTNIHLKMLQKKN